MEVYGAQAFDGVSKERLIREIGISEADFDVAFSSLERLYADGVILVKSEILEAVRFDDGVDFQKGLHIVVRRFVTYVSERPRLFQALLSSGTFNERTPEVANVVRDTRQEIVKRIAEKMGVPEHIPMIRLLIRGTIGFVESTTLAWTEKRDLHLEQLIELISGALDSSLIPLAKMVPRDP